MEEEDRYTRITLRIPKELQAQIARAALATSKSQNAEIIARLQGSFGVKSLSTLGLSGDITQEAATSRYIARSAYQAELDRQKKDLQDMIEAAAKPAIQKVMEQYLEQERKDRERLVEQLTGIKPTLTKR